MTLIPELKIGLLNAWLPILFFNIFMIALPHIVNPQGAKRAVDTSWYEKKDKKFVVLTFIFWFGQIIYGVWVTLKIGTTWFNIGAVITIAGFIFYTIANNNYMTVPLDKAITRGLYKISRNPLYLFSGIIMIGISLAAASWIMLVIIAIYWAINHQTIKAEERYCFKTYGEEYRKYMDKVPRYILFF
jgi:protein-S-isoprenylcysteine O-methyltransferase Ste14